MLNHRTYVHQLVPDQPQRISQHLHTTSLLNKRIRIDARLFDELPPLCKLGTGDVVSLRRPLQRLQRRVVFELLLCQLVGEKILICGCLEHPLVYSGVGIVRRPVVQQITQIAALLQICTHLLNELEPTLHLQAEDVFRILQIMILRKN